MARKIKDRFIKILEGYADNASDVVLTAELVGGGYLYGDIVENEDGHVVGSEPKGMTTKGRLFLASLQSEQDANSLKSRAIGWLKGAILFLAGLFASDLQALGHALVKLIAGLSN